MGALVPHVQRPVTQRLRFGPFRGMRTAAEERASDPSLVQYALNMLPDDPVHGGAYVVRPPVIATSGFPSGFVRGFARYTSVSGTALQGTVGVAVTNGSTGVEIWSFSLATWTRQITGTVTAAAGVGLSSTGLPIYYLSRGGQLIVSDGENPPWMWDGTFAGGITLLSNCPPLYGPPTEYAGKIFGIKAADRRTIVWSEENDPTTGYQSGGFNNAWTISQQAEEPLVRLLGRNDGLYYWRSRGFGMIAGAVAGDFRTTHTHDAISSSLGTIDPRSVVDAGVALYWYDTSERVMRYAIGGLPQDMAPDVGVTGHRTQGDELLTDSLPQWARESSYIRAPDNVTATLVEANDVTRRPQIWMGLSGTRGGALPPERSSLILVLDAVTGAPLGYLGGPLGTLGVAYHLTAVPPSLAGGSITSLQPQPFRDVVLSAQTNNSGPPLLWQWVPASGPVSADAFTGLPVTGYLLGPVAGGDDTTEQVWTRCDVATRLPAKAVGETAATIQLTPLSPTNASPGVLTANPAPDPVNLTTGKTSYGLDSLGRWLRPLFTCQWNGTAQGYGIQGYTLHATAASEDPDAA